MRLGIVVLGLFLIASSSCAASSLGPAYGAGLEGNMVKALAILDSLDHSGWSAKDSAAAACMGQTFRSPPQSEDLPPHSKSILTAYRRYWQDLMMQRRMKADAEKDLLAALNGELPPDSAATDLDTATERIKSVIRSERLYALTGITSPYYELMLWRVQSPNTYRVRLPEGAVNVSVVFLDQFVSLGWAGYATCGRYHSGGWATQDSLYAVRSAYDLGTESFRVSYLAHEGQHFFDYGRFPKLEQPELEYRAKLTEIAESDSTTYDLILDFAGMSGTDRSVPHQFANYWVARDLGRAVFGSNALVTDPARWRGVAAKRLRSAAARLLAGNSAIIRKRGATTTERFLSEGAGSTG